MAYQKRFEDLHDDLTLMVSCVKEVAPNENNNPPKRERVLGGFEALRRFKPIYFHDPLYRRKRHDFIRDMVLADEQAMEQIRRNASK
jgi:hypothetical protein